MDWSGEEPGRDAEELAQRVSSLSLAGTGGMICAALAPMCCYISSVPGLALGGWAAWSAWQEVQALGHGEEDALARASLNAALISGLVAAGMSAMFLAVFVLVVLVYGFIFLAAAVGGLSA